mmetsp:Transcript_2978/g.7267  ORF Transcript_2978/g.7267 Transcript_2978/m.7267 type:complete len:269 (-) Transcript_2978:180-986(-)
MNLANQNSLVVSIPTQRQRAHGTTNHFVINHGGGRVASSGGCNMDRNEVILAWVSQACVRSESLPFGERATTFLGAVAGIGEQLAKPLVKRCAGCRSAGAEQVVCGHAGADDEHTLISERCERFAQPQVLFGAHGAQHAQLHDGNVRTWKHSLERHEYAVIEAPLPLQRGTAQELSELSGEFEVPARLPLELVGCTRKAVVVEKEGVLFACKHRWPLTLPMGAYHKEGAHILPDLLSVSFQETIPGALSPHTFPSPFVLHIEGRTCSM